MSHNRHSYIPFYPSDWIAGTARMTAMQELVYFRVCCHIWDKAAPVPENELPLLLGNIENWQEILAQLVSAGKLNGTPNGYANGRALAIAEKARGTWQAKVDAGKAGADKRWKDKRKGKETKAKQLNGTPNGKDGVLPIENQNQNHISNSTDVLLGTPKEKRAARLPEDFEVPEDWKAWAIEEGWPSERVATEAENFRDHWQSAGGQNARKLNWRKAWQVWMRRTPKPKEQNDGKTNETRSREREERIARVVASLGS